MAVRAFRRDRPFYWSGGIERETNGRWTVEVYYWHRGNGRNVLCVSVESHHGWNANGTVDSDGWIAYDIPGVPAYVREHARRMVRVIMASDEGN